MTYIKPVKREDRPELEPYFAAAEASMGFVPTSILTMAHWPELLKGFMALTSVTMVPGTVDPELRKLIVFLTSSAAGCRYCQAHNVKGLDQKRVAAAFDFEKSDAFTERERAALRVAFYSGTVPNGVEEAHMNELKQYFSDREVLEIVGLIATFGFLNRWNDTMASTLEELPLTHAQANLSAFGWEAGKHGIDKGRIES